MTMTQALFYFHQSYSNVNTCFLYPPVPTKKILYWPLVVKLHLQTYSGNQAVDRTTTTIIWSSLRALSYFSISVVLTHL